MDSETAITAARVKTVATLLLVVRVNHAQSIGAARRITAPFRQVHLAGIQVVLLVVARAGHNYAQPVATEQVVPQSVARIQDSRRAPQT